MKVQRFVPLVLVLFLGMSCACQLSLGKIGSQKINAAPDPSQKTANSSLPGKGPSDKEFDECRQQVSQKFVNGDFQWIDREASKFRLTKARLPGGYWKLRALYDALEVPQTAADGDAEWEAHIATLQRWMKQAPRSITARVALAASWKNYAWKARGGGYARTVTVSGSELFDNRLASAAQVLNDAASLDERCPHWFVTSLFVGTGQSWDRVAFERVFEAAVKFEPTYYYLYQAKATYLLPRWYGEAGEWERFVDESTRTVGGPEGDIIFFAVYSQMLALHDVPLNNHGPAWPRLLSGFRAIEKLYGAAPHRLNEACFFSFGNDHRTSVELFNRIGEDYDHGVWRSKKNYETHRQGAIDMEKDERGKQNPALSAS